MNTTMSKPVTIFTIGFAKKTAQQFFDILIEAGVKQIVDARLNNVSQLAGFTKKKDLEYFLKTIGQIDYIHVPEFAPSKQILDEYKKNGGDWLTYEEQFNQLISSRKIEDKFDPQLLDRSCLLCAEPTPENCHRRLVAEYLQYKWQSVNIKHL